MKYFSKQEKEKTQFLTSQMHSELHAHTSFVIEESYMKEKFFKSTFPKVSIIWNTKRRHEEFSHKLKSS